MPALVADSAADTNPDLQVMRVNIHKPRNPRVSQRNYHATTIDYFLNRDGQAIVQELYSNTADLHRLTVRTSWREIYREKTIMALNVSAVTPDSSAIVALRYNDNTGRAEYSAMALRDGELSSGLFSKAGADVDSIVTDINRVAHGVWLRRPHLTKPRRSLKGDLEPLSIHRGQVRLQRRHKIVHLGKQ